MKIVNVTPGLIPIPPNGWGAVEKIIWELHTNLLALGHDSHIMYLDDVPSDADIVHIHVANLALLAHERGIPYYFTFHDHHAYLYGKDSDVYKENLLAMQHAVKSFVPAKYLVEYFNGVPEYFSHGVNTLQFYPSNNRQKHKLLCVANNGYAYDQSVDRKGFGIAIEAARGLGLPITIAGPSNNKHYFEKNPSTYDKLTVLYDLTEDELRKLYQEHTIFVHPSELEAGHPNLTLLEALASGLPVVGTYEHGNSLKGMVTCSRNVALVEASISDVIYEYQLYKVSAREQAEQLSWKNRTKELLHIYTQQAKTMRHELLKQYGNTVKLNKSPLLKTTYHNVDGMFLEINGGPDTVYDVQFIDCKTNTPVFSLEMVREHWARPNAKYYVDWKVVVKDKNTGITNEHRLNLTGKRVFISLESKSLGDTIAWFPYVEEFRKKHNCVVICSTFWNDMFSSEYPEIQFVNPGEAVHNLAALYRVGLFYAEDGNIDYSMHPTNPITGPLQKIASDILGLDFTEIKPRIKTPNVTTDNQKQVCIAVHSTAQSKYWNNPTGWQEVVDWLNARGYTVKLLSQEGDGYMGNKNPTGVIQMPPSPISDVIAELKKSAAFIGLSSGLTWVSWAAEVPTVLVSGFTYDFNEMRSCIRISAPSGKCSGCWNRHKFNPGDWNWCPDHKNTPRQFECSKTITADMVIRELEKIL